MLARSDPPLAAPDAYVLDGIMKAGKLMPVA
jgi:hypothetical protein